jgi:hypothetical protein
MFWTNPRPCRRLILGVTSFEGGGLRNAGEGLMDGICGPKMAGLRFGGTRPANAGVGVVTFRGVLGVGLEDTEVHGGGEAVVAIGDL